MMHAFAELIVRERIDKAIPNRQVRRHHVPYPDIEAMPPPRNRWRRR